MIAVDQHMCTKFARTYCIFHEQTVIYEVPFSEEKYKHANVQLDPNTGCKIGAANTE